MNARRATLLLFGLAFAQAAFAADLELLSRVPYSAGAAQPGDAMAGERRAFSADGRYFVFTSSATAVVPGVLDLNGDHDVFLADRQSGVVRLISFAAASPRLAGRAGSYEPRLSADGRYVFYGSKAGDLVAPATSGRQVFRYDRETGVNRLVSHQAGQPGLAAAGDSYLADVSADGRHAAIASTAPAAQLVPGKIDINAGEDLFSFNADSDSFQLVTYKIDFPLETPGLVTSHADARVADDGKIAFHGPRRLAVPGDGGAMQVYVFDPATGANLLVSAAAGAPGTASSGGPICDFSPDGRFLLFSSAAADLVAGQADAASTADLFLYDRDGEGLELISARPGQPATTGNAASACGRLSADGRWAYFPTDASDLVAGVTDGGGYDLLRRDRQNAATRLISAHGATPGTAAGSVARTLGYIGPAVQPLAADGSSLLFASSAALAPGSVSQPGPWSYRWSNLNETLEAAAPPPSGPEALTSSQPRAVTADGAAALYLLDRPYAAGGLANPAVDDAQLMLRDEATGALALAAPAAFAGSGSTGRTTVFPEAPGPPAVPLTSLGYTQDGRQLLLQSADPDLAPLDANHTLDLFLYDLESETYEIVSHAAGAPDTAADRGVFSASGPSLMTPDGSRIVFYSQSTDLVAGATTGNDVFLADRQSGATRLISSRHDDPLAGGDGASLSPQISADGNFVLFYSRASNLVAGFVDFNGAFPADLYLRDVAAGTTALVSHVAFDPLRGAIDAGTARISANGRYVAHTNNEQFMMTGATDTNGWADLFRYDRTSGANTLISHTGADPLTASGGRCSLSGLSADGRFVLMRCDGSDLVAGVAGPQYYLWDGDTGGIRLVSHRRGASQIGVGGPAGVGLGQATIAPDGSRVFYITAATDVIPGLVDAANTGDAFVWERATLKVELLTARFGRSHEAAGVACRFGAYTPPATGGESLVLSCSGPSLVRFDNNLYEDDFLVRLPTPLFADGFESGTTAVWN